MTKLIKNGKLVNVFTGELEEKNILIQDERIAGIGDYETADEIYDVTGKTICPSFIDSHIHIESSLLTPPEFAKVCVPHGTGAVIADPHEIANVCGIEGIRYFLDAGKDLPMDYFFTLPSCVPASPFDENGANLSADDYKNMYDEAAVIGLGEVMNYPGVINGDEKLSKLIAQAEAHGRVACGHAPKLSGKALDRYIAAGIYDDHECASFDEAVEKLRKGQWIMIREGSSAKNLESLIDLFDEPYCHRCMLATDDKLVYELVQDGHIDAIIRKAVRLGKNPITGIRMATLQTAMYYGLKHYGAVAPGYYANLVVLDDLESINVCGVFHKGEQVFSNGMLIKPNDEKEPCPIPDSIRGSFRIKELTPEDFHIEPEGELCRVIGLLPKDLITENLVRKIDFDHDNGIDLKRDIIKIAVCERHKMTGHIGLGFVEGFGFKRGAMASSVSHDSHNLIIAGTNENDMALAGNQVREMGGGFCVACDGEIIGTLPLPVAGLMSDGDADTITCQNTRLKDAIAVLEGSKKIEVMTHLAFISLPVIPSLKMTTQGLVDVDRFEFTSLFVQSDESYSE